MVAPGDGAEPPPRKSHTLLIVGIVLAVLGALAVCSVTGFVILLAPAFMKAKQKANQTKCANNLRQIAIAAIQYADDTRRFPHDPSDPTGRKALEALAPNYVDNAEVFTCPACDPGDFSYEGFPVPLTSNAPSNRPLVWDRRPHPDGSRNVVFADAHATRVDGAAFETLLEAARAAPEARGR